MKSRIVKFVVSHFFFFPIKSRMTIEGNTETDNIGQQHFGRKIWRQYLWLLEMSVPFDDMDQMFYHRFRPSNELCSAGLFTLDPHNTSKKHRRMKCKYRSMLCFQSSFCNSVMCGWKDKFCKHLDRCQRAQEVGAMFLISIFSILLLIRSTPSWRWFSERTSVLPIQWIFS